MTDYLEHQEAVLQACQRLSAMGFLAATGGNVALRTGDNTFAVTPSAADYHALTPDDICIVRLDNLAVVAATRKPSVESAMHATLLRFRPDLVASVHTHQPIASAVALLGTPMVLYDPSAKATLGPKVAVAGYAPSGTRLLVYRLRRVLRREVNAYLLRNHGVVCGGHNMDAAIDNVVILEREAARALHRRIVARGGDALPPGLKRMVLATLENSKIGLNLPLAG